MCRFGHRLGRVVMHFPVCYRGLCSRARIICQHMNRLSTHSNAGTDSTNGSHQNPSDTTFWDMMETRTEQASRTLLVKVPKNISVDGMLRYLKAQVGSIANYYPYSQKERYAIVEFDKESSLKRIFKKKKKAHFLSLSASSKIKDCNQGQDDWPVINEDIEGDRLVEHLTNATSVSDQLDAFYKVQRLQEPEIRLRFLLCLLLEDSFQTLLPDCNIYPFGSSVNGFGRRNCDVDMYLDRATPKGIVPIIKTRNGSQSYDLRYDKQAAKSDRVGTQLTLRSLSQLLRQSVPYVKDVFPILQANCPLVKFIHSATGLSCDLTADNRLGLTSSQLLYVYGNLDLRVRHLVFIIRHWARMSKITSPHAGPWITNFPLTVMVIFFLQTRSPAIVPSLDFLRSIADSSDKGNVGGVDTTFVGDFSKVPPSQNTQSPESLLQEFFHFCTTFDFEHKAMSTRRAESYAKPDNDKYSLYIENPFETSRNASQNVSNRIVGLLRDSARTSLDIMNRTDFAIPKEPSSLSQDGATPLWGVSLLIQANKEDNRVKTNRTIANIMNILENDSDATRTDLSKDEGHHSGNDDDRVTQGGSEELLEGQTPSTDDQLDGAASSEGTTLEDATMEPASAASHMYTSLLYMYGQKNKVKVEFTFTEEKASNSRVFKAQCHIGGRESTTGIGKTKKIAKHEAARSMLLNLPSTAAI